MSQSEQKIVQYLNEAHALEVGLARVLRSQIAMSPRGLATAPGSRSTCARRRRTPSASRRGRASSASAGNPLRPASAFMEDIAEPDPRALEGAAGSPAGREREEKVLENAKDACATEALEIATYTALEHLARAVGDDATAKLAASIRADEERMLERVRASCRSSRERSCAPRSTDARPSTSPRPARPTRSARRPTRQARAAARRPPPAPGAPDPRCGDARGAARRPGRRPPRDLAIPGYDDLTAEDIGGRLAGLSQSELATVDAYERTHGDRSTILSGSRRCGPTSPGTATTRSPSRRSARSRPRATTTRAPTPCARTSARTRTAPAS